MCFELGEGFDESRILLGVLVDRNARHIRRNLEESDLDHVDASLPTNDAINAGAAACNLFFKTVKSSAHIMYYLSVGMFHVKRETQTPYGGLQQAAGSMHPSGASRPCLPRR